MHLPNLAAPLFLLIATALTTPVVLPRDDADRVLIFEGATPEATYTIQPADDGMQFTISHPEISVSHITLNGTGSCQLAGVDGSNTTVMMGQTVDVGPPQVQVSGICSA